MSPQLFDSGLGSDAPTPKQIVAELDKYIVGQEKAKRAVAIAIRNHYRRRELHPSFQEEVTPKNILMIGPTGVGKTEIARRIARFISAPFIKVEVTKFTEVGYVGRDVDSMVRELVEAAINMVRAEEREKIEEAARRRAEDKLLDILAPLPKVQRTPFLGEQEDATLETAKRYRRERRQEIRDHSIDDTEIDVEVYEPTVRVMDFSAMPGMEEMGTQIQQMLEGNIPKKKKKRKMKIAEAHRAFLEQEFENLLDREKITQEGLRRAQQNGIVFLDEMDKIAAPAGGHGHGPDVSREGVQRDLLPVVEGTSVSTKYGPVKTDHILFIGAGAFHMSKPSDLIPELQGRFPVRVELESLTTDDFKRILIEPENALTKQYQELLRVDGVNLKFTQDGIEELATTAFKVNEGTQDIGARRLHTVVERCLEDVAFRAPDPDLREVVVDRKFVKATLKDILASEDLQKYIL
ncbi:MAG: ATP-dependent protease ATPase subunit HslU [bacterium]